MEGGQLSFDAPMAFWLLIPVLALPLQARWTGRNRLKVGSIDDMNTGWTLRRAVAWLPSALRVLGLVLLVVAMARPRTTQHDVMVESEGLDIILALDTSGSMEARDLESSGRNLNRLELSKRVIAQFIEGRPNDRIGLVVFGEEAFTHVPLTLDHDALQSVLGQVGIGVAGAQGTAIGSALAVSAKRLKDLEAPERLVVLLTDGRNNSGRVSPMQAAQAAAALDMKVYTIGVGRQRRGLLGAFDDGLDERVLNEIADATGGQYFRAQDSSALEEVYEQINVLEPSPAQVRQIVSHTEQYRMFAAPGFLLLLVQMLLGATWLRRGP